jgi:hypothetical protein
MTRNWPENFLGPVPPPPIWQNCINFSIANFLERTLKNVILSILELIEGKPNYTYVAK